VRSFDLNKQRQLGVNSMKIFNSLLLILCLAPSLASALAVAEKADPVKRAAVTKNQQLEARLAMVEQAYKGLATRNAPPNPSCVSDAQCGHGTCDLVTNLCVCTDGWMTAQPVGNPPAIPGSIPASQQGACEYPRPDGLKAVLLHSILLGYFGAGEFSLGNNGYGAGQITLTVTGVAMIIGGVVVAGCGAVPVGVPMAIVGVAELAGNFGWWIYDIWAMATQTRTDGNGQQIWLPGKW
jgi:hypothetical protein